LPFAMSPWATMISWGPRTGKSYGLPRNPWRSGRLGGAAGDQDQRQRSAVNLVAGRAVSGALGVWRKKPNSWRAITSRRPDFSSPYRF
jgi:hypothetical protein